MRLSEEIKAMDFADVEPLIIKFGDQVWRHPFIESWFEPNEETEKDYDLTFMELGDDRESIEIFFKSDYITRKIQSWSEAEADGSELFNKPYIDLDNIVFSFEILFLEDVWVPTRLHRDGPINSREWAKMREGSEQFRFTDLGEKIADFYKSSNAICCKKIDFNMLGKKDEEIVVLK